MKQIQLKLQAQFDKMCQTGKLFRSKVSGSEVWTTYLTSFEDDPIFRDPESSTHNCNHCKNFVRRYGNIVAIVDGQIKSIWSDITDAGDYQPSVNACATLLESAGIENIFVETYEMLNSLPYESCSKKANSFQLGVAENGKIYTQEEADKFGRVVAQKRYEFHHLYLNIPKAFISFGSDSEGKILGEAKSRFEVFNRFMREISTDTVILMKDLVAQNSLLDSVQHSQTLRAYIEFKKEYEKASTPELFSWVKSVELQGLAKFGSSLQGEFLKELSEGKELNEACRAYNQRIDPVNYMKAKAPITEAQRKLAEKFVIENGYLSAFTRRLANMEDIKASEILHINRGDKAATATIFSSVPTNKSRHKRSEFDKVETVSIDKFMSEILPTCSTVELFLEGRMDGNLVNLTTISDSESKQIFKWNNPFSYTFNGNLAGKSQIRDAVKGRGGKVDAQVRVSIHFPKTSDDYDLHCHEPNGNHIFYRNKRIMHPSSGMLDLDAQGTDGNFPPEKRVENLTYSDISRMPDDDYKLSVNNYSRRGLHTDFNVETEINGDITTWEFTGITKSNTASIGILRKKGNEVVYIPSNCKEIESKATSKTMWNLESNNFHKVNMMCLTPNHWGTDSVGNKHYLFMLQGCKNPNPVRGFHNEHLISDLMSNRKVLDVLGDSALIPPTDNQIAGVGFNATVRDEVILRLTGSFKRVIKVQF